MVLYLSWLYFGLLPLCRCDKPCTDGTYGDGCRFLCKTCNHGHCDHVTGSCICLPGFQGERWEYSGIYRLFLTWYKIQMSVSHRSICCSCNSSCPLNLYGVNCSSTCDCGNHACHPATGACPNSMYRHHIWFSQLVSASSSSIFLYVIFMLGSRAGLLAGLLIPLCILILALLFCCCCCGGPIEGKEGYEFVIWQLI